jgi:hypothetical protein
MQTRVNRAAFNRLPRTELVREVLRDIDDARNRLRWKQRELDLVLTELALPEEYGGLGDEEDIGGDELAQLYAAWCEFRRCGGVTSNDWQRWLNGQPLGRPASRGKRHLRLIIARTSQPRVRLHPRPYDGGGGEGGAGGEVA